MHNSSLPETRTYQDPVADINGFFSREAVAFQGNKGLFSTLRAVLGYFTSELLSSIYVQAHHEHVYALFPSSQYLIGLSFKLNHLCLGVFLVCTKLMVY